MPLAPVGPRGRGKHFTLCLGIALPLPTLKKVSCSQSDRYKFVTGQTLYGGDEEKLAWAPRVGGALQATLIDSKCATISSNKILGKGCD